MFIKGSAKSRKTVNDRKKALRRAHRKLCKELADLKRRQSPTLALEREIGTIKACLRQLSLYKVGQQPASLVKIHEALAQYREYLYHSHTSMGMMAHAEVAKLELVDAILAVYGQQLNTEEKFHQAYPYLQVHTSSDHLDIIDVKNMIRLQVEHFLHLAESRLAKLA